MVLGLNREQHQVLSWCLFRLQNTDVSGILLVCLHTMARGKDIGNSLTEANVAAHRSVKRFKTISKPLEFSSSIMRYTHYIQDTIYKWKERNKSQHSHSKVRPCTKENSVLRNHVFNFHVTIATSGAVIGDYMFSCKEGPKEPVVLVPSLV